MCVSRGKYILSLSKCQFWRILSTRCTTKLPYKHTMADIFVYSEVWQRPKSSNVVQGNKDLKQKLVIRVVNQK